jgi:hypothetical protein
MKRSRGEPKLIYRARGNEHYFPTPDPAYYYGMPDNNVYVIYSNHCENSGGKAGFELIIAKLEEFSYNYEKETLHAYKDNNIWSLTMKEAVCGWTQKMNILKTYKMAETRLSPVTARAIMNKFYTSKTKQ